jgi:O-antigen ligase
MSLPAAEFAQPSPAATGRRLPRPRDLLKVRLDPLRLVVCLLIVLVVSRLHQYVPILAKARPLVILTFLAAAYSFGNPRLLSRESLFRTWPARVLAGLCLMSVLSIPFGISVGNSGKFILDVYLKNITLAFIILASARSTRDLYAYAWAYVVGALILTYFALFFYDLARYGSDFSYQRLAGFATWDANDVVLVLMSALACSLLVLQVAKGTGKLVASLALVGIGATVARSGSRGGFLGLVAVGVGLLLIGGGIPVMRRVAMIAVVTLGLAVWSPAGYWEQMQTIMNPTEDYNYQSKDGRKEVGKRGMGYMLARPVFGLGINNFSKAECTISEKARNTPAGHGLRCMPPHNSFVQAGAELGVPGLLLWSSIPVLGIVALLKLRKRLPQRWKRGTREERFLILSPSYLALACVGFIVTAFFLNFAWMEPYYVLAALVAACMAITERRVAEQAVAARESAWLDQPVPDVQGVKPIAPGQARYPRPFRVLPSARLRPGDMSSL